MFMTQKAIFCRSGAKDSACALYKVRPGGRFEIVAPQTSYAGRVIDDTVIFSLAAGIDPSGVNREFHSSVFDEPLFGSIVKFQTTDKVHSEGVYFRDPVPAAVESYINNTESVE